MDAETLSSLFQMAGKVELEDLDVDIDCPGDFSVRAKIGRLSISFAENSKGSAAVEAAKIIEGGQSKTTRRA